MAGRARLPLSFPGMNQGFRDRSGRPVASRGAWRIPLLLATLIVALIVYGLGPRPCRRPLSYRIGTVDARFGVSREDFSEAVKQATSIWRERVPRELFREEPNGVVEINLVYDFRQESADRLKALSLQIGNTKASYEELKSRFLALKAEAEEKGGGLSQDFATYNQRVAAFNGRMEAARRQGGLSDSVHRRFESERRELDSQKEELQRRQNELKAIGETLNSLVVVVNGIATNLNLDVVDYRETGDKLGPEFSEGEYVRDGQRQSITVYHFPSRDGLVRVLTHEFGHAMGIAHLENPQAIMHRLMRSESLELAPEDIAALKAKCGFR